MNKEQVIEAIRQYHSDTSRPIEETLEGLLDIAAEAEALAEAAKEELQA